MEDFPIPDELLEKIVAQTTKLSTPKEFLEVFNGVKANPILKRILSLGETELEEQIQKLTYATIMFDDARKTAIGEDNIKAPGMTLDKLCTIAVGDPEADELLEAGLTLEQIKAMTGEYLAHPGMTVSKITLTGFGTTPQQIIDIGPQTIIDTPTEDLVMLFF